VHEKNGKDISRLSEENIPASLNEKIKNLPNHVTNPDVLSKLIIELCAWRPMRSIDLARLLNRSEKYLLRKFINPLRKEGLLEFRYPEMTNHPQQSYKVSKD
jgi:ATP-dependent DNA helicase RecG